MGREQTSVLGDADHSEDLDEVRRKAEGTNLLASVGRFNEQLDDESDSTGIDVVDLGEIENDTADVVFGQGLIGAQNGFL